MDNISKLTLSKCVSVAQYICILKITCRQKASDTRRSSQRLCLRLWYIYPLVLTSSPFSFFDPHHPQSVRLTHQNCLCLLCVRFVYISTLILHLVCGKLIGRPEVRGWIFILFNF